MCLFWLHSGIAARGKGYRFVNEAADELNNNYTLLELERSVAEVANLTYEGTPDNERLALISGLIVKRADGLGKKLIEDGR